MTPMISIDLEDRARRSESFPTDWPEGKLQDAIGRYQRFLQLAAKHPDQALAPTRDIDEIWHLHMLSPRAYYEDCQRIVGKLLDHDGGFGAEPEEIPILAANFRKTARLWQEEYGEPYVAEGEGDQSKNCWHDCQGRCWHACSSK